MKIRNRHTINSQDTDSVIQWIVDNGGDTLIDSQDTKHLQSGDFATRFRVFAIGGLDLCLEQRWRGDLNRSDALIEGDKIRPLWESWWIALPNQYRNGQTLEAVKVMVSNRAKQMPFRPDAPISAGLFVKSALEAIGSSRDTDFGRAATQAFQFAADCGVVALTQTQHLGPDRE